MRQTKPQSPFSNEDGVVFLNVRQYYWRKLGGILFRDYHYVWKASDAPDIDWGWAENELSDEDLDKIRSMAFKPTELCPICFLPMTKGTEVPKCLRCI